MRPFDVVDLDPPNQRQTVPGHHHRDALRLEAHLVRLDQGVDLQLVPQAVAPSAGDAQPQTMLCRPLAPVLPNEGLDPVGVSLGDADHVAASKNVFSMPNRQRAVDFGRGPVYFSLAMSNVEVKSDRRYTKDHEWAKSDGAEIVVGITAYAVDQLGDITLVNIDVAEGDDVEAGATFGTVDSVKAVSELFAPIAGKVVRLNADLEDRPELLNEDCYGEGWLLAVEPTDSSELDRLLDADAYAKLCDEQS